MVELAWQIMMGVGLASSAGLRAFLPLLVVGLAGRLELVPLSASFAWMSTTPALIAFGVAVCVEVVGDKFPLVDHFLDAAGTLVRPVAGALVAAAPITSLDPLTGLVVGVILGGAAAGGVHAAKATLRVVSSTGTGGLANPLISASEDAASLSGSVLSLFVPVVTFTLAVAVLCLFVFYLLAHRGSGAGDADLARGTGR